MIAEQLNIFEISKPKYKITKPIRLIEDFAGIGSQAKALKNIGANFEHYRAIDFDKYAIKSYNAIHGTNFEPLDITKITAKDLGIVETDKYDYIMTYSFPCQDLSPAGKGAGMKKGSGTRSGLLWEVERLLKECKELPQILLMENVPQVINKKHFKDFREWQLFLEKLGYSNYFKLLNAKNYGIPQTRNRCFMISILGDYYYQFPRKQKLKYRIKDFLEDEVDEKYYLSEKALCLISKIDGKQPKIQEATKKGYEVISGEFRRDTGIITFKDNVMGTIRTNNSGGDKIVIVKSNYSPSNHNASRIVDKNIYIDEFNRAFIKIGNMFYRIRKLTPKECWRLMGFSDEDFDKASKVNSNNQLYKQAGNSIVVQVLEALFKELM